MKRRLNLSRYKPKPEPTEEEIAAEQAAEQARAEATTVKLVPYTATLPPLPPLPPVPPVIVYGQARIPLTIIDHQIHESMETLRYETIALDRRLPDEIVTRHDYTADVTFAHPLDAVILTITGRAEGDLADIVIFEREGPEQAPNMYKCDTVEYTIRPDMQGATVTIRGLQLRHWHNRTPQLHAIVRGNS